jgi:hypothetical protein
VKTICSDCGASWETPGEVDLVSHGYCRPCGERRLSAIRARAICGAELRGRGAEVLDRCALLGKHDGKPHHGKYGKWARSSDAPAITEMSRDARAGRTSP